MAFRFLFSWIIAMVLSFNAITDAQSQAVGPPVGPDEAKSKVGEFLTTFTERSPQSVIAKIDKRMDLKPGAAVEDYDVSKEVFDIDVPKEAGANGKYGVIVAMCYPGHQWPPMTWRPILEKYHLIWVGAIIATDSRPVEQHVQLLLDAAYNASKLWPTDYDRTYLASINVNDAMAGMAFYYSDVFPGTIVAPGLQWFYKLKDTRPNYGMWETANMPRPQAVDWDRAKNKSRFFLAMRDDNQELYINTIINQGYKAGGFKHVKTLKVPFDAMARYTDWHPEWLEQGIEFLDSATAPADVVVAATPKTQPPHDQDAAVKANSSLQLAKNYVELGRYDSARTKLRQIIDIYPGTPAAKEAQQVLKDIADK